ncbi:hypothetical protein G4H71_17260 [Rhodococcus triatomae]|nr:hypothetical protein G4H72_13115 [Rhodococcus triatomae]QNG25839.1 hypothetical protein G4H71_17260 [Rhodococcus triatomae]
MPPRPGASYSSPAVIPTCSERYPPLFSKVLVANRGEIAIRAFRAAYELGAGTVAVFPFEDRNSLHRSKAETSSPS